MRINELGHLADPDAVKNSDRVRVGRFVEIEGTHDAPNVPHTRWEEWDAVVLFVGGGGAKVRRDGDSENEWDVVPWEHVREVLR